MSALPMIPPNADDPPKPPAPSKTIQRWDTFIGDLASGMPQEEARMKSYVTRADVETMCRLDDGGVQKQRYEDARLAGRKRAWSMQHFEEIFDHIAAGATTENAVMLVTGKKINETTFYQLVNADPDLERAYRKAQASRMLALGEQTLTEVNDRSRDVIKTFKGPAPNMAAVSRSKLIADHTYRYMGAYNAKVFGEKKENVAVQVNLNLGETLEAARNRDKLRDKRVTPKQMEQAVEAVFSQKTEAAAPAEKEAAEEPLDAIWREEK